MKKNIDKQINKIHIGYYTRLIIMILFIIFLSIVANIFLKKSIITENAKEINYCEVGNVDYRVYLKENDFYEEDFLLPGMSYIASIIKNITIDYSYSFTIDKKTSANFYYDIVGTLVITDSSEKNIFFTKNYNLLDSQIEKIENDNRIDINKTINIDYDYYNKLAQNFKNAYGVDTISNLTITMKLKKLGENSIKNFEEDKAISLKIPLTQKALNINIQPVDLKNNNQVISKSKIIISNKGMFIFSVALFLIILYLIIKIVKYILLLLPKKTKFQLKVNKILRTYDRLIANVKTLPNFNDYEIVKIDNFNELVDIRDNLKVPIMYFNVNDGEKCYFYIEYFKKLYLLTLKAVDMEDKKGINLNKNSLNEKKKKELEKSFKEEKKR